LPQLLPGAALRQNPSVEHSIPTDRFQREAVTPDRYVNDWIGWTLAMDETPECL